MTSTRERIVDAAVGLFRRQGYVGTGVKQIVAEAGAPFGSLYHFFPGGKEQLGEEVIRTSGTLYLQLIDAYLEPAPDPVTAVRDFFAGAAEVLRQTDYADACPIAAVALEVASTSEPLRRATADVFESWIDGGTGYLERQGIPRARARELTIAMLAALEGAFVLSRAARTTEALDVAAHTMATAVEAAVAATPRPHSQARHGE